MKSTLKLFALLFIFIVPLMRAQSDVVISMDSLKKKAGAMMRGGYDLNDGWKFHAGDNPEWSAVDFNDSSWENWSLHFTLDTLKHQEFPGIGWFRIRVRIDSTLYNKPVALAMWHLGATHVFINGKFAGGYGKPGKSIEGEVFAQPVVSPLVVTFSSDSIQTIAIRFSNFHLVQLPKLFWRTLISAGIVVRLVEANYGLGLQISGLHDSIALQGLIVGILFALGFSHLLIYFFYNRNLLSLHFGLMSVSLATILYLGYKLLVLQSIIAVYVVALLQLVLLPALFLFLVLFLFTMRFSRLPKRANAYILFAVIIACTAVFYFHVMIINSMIGLFVLLAGIEAVVSFIRMIREKREGIGVLIAGASFFIGFWIFSFAISLFSLQHVFPGWLLEIFVYASFISLPFSMSLYLARSYSKTNTDLEHKLTEVQTLSEAAIEQERQSGELRLQKEVESARALEAELRAQAAELQAKTSELLAQNLQMENERTAKELEDARRLQLSMLPASVPQKHGYEIDVFMKTATEVGGDYYDFISLSESLVVAFGDAAGHGVKAGIMVTAAKSFFSGLAAGMQPAEFLAFTSKAMKEMKLSPLYMCMLLGRLEQNTFRYASAGMPQILHYRKSENNVAVIESKNAPLGTVFQVAYTESVVPLQPGDVLLLLSDGIIEMFNHEREMFGLHRVSEVFLGAIERTPAEILSQLNECISAWTGSEQPADDVSFLIIKRNS